MNRHASRTDDEMMQRHRQERMRLPKIQQKDAKIRMLQFKKSLRISSVYQQRDSVDVDAAFAAGSGRDKDKVKKVIDVYGGGDRRALLRSLFDDKHSQLSWI